MSSKINWLINNTNPGSIVLQSWLSQNDIPPSLTQKYTKSNWLIKLRAGVYVRPGREPNWQDALYCLTHQLNIPIHLAGLSSLAYQGKAHYLQHHEDKIWVHVSNKATLPKWFKEYDNSPWTLVTNNKLDSINQYDLTTIETKGTKLATSTAELAAYEILEAIPRLISFEQAAELLQGLVNLSPKKVESLLKRSQSIRSNRLYLFFAHYYKHPWIKRIDESTINLGSGKRQITANGKLDKRYQITVPEKFILEESADG